MISRSAIGRNAQLALRRQCCAKPTGRRGMAAAASESTSTRYENEDVAGIKVASRDVAGPTTKLAVVVKAGSRYEPLPGLAFGLERYAFKNTEKRSALRINREAELLGGQLNAYHTRESLVVEAKFLQKDLPYFTELLGEVVSETKYTNHEYQEEIEETLALRLAKIHADVSQLAIDSAHHVAFHRGLGNSVYPSSADAAKYLNETTVAEYAADSYAKSNLAVVANGASQAELSKWVGQFFTGVRAESQTPLSKKAATYYGGEERLSHGGGNAFVLAFPGSSSFTAGSSYKPELAVLATLLGGQSSIKWSPGFSLLSKTALEFPGTNIATSHFAYSDAGLLAIKFTGSSVGIRDASVEALKVLKAIASGSINKDDVTKAVALTKYNVLEAAESLDTGLVSTGAGILHGGKPFNVDEVSKSVDGVTADKLKSAAKALLDGKASVSAVGDLHVLPYASELGLNV